MKTLPRLSFCVTATLWFAMIVGCSSNGSNSNSASNAPASASSSPAASAPASSSGAQAPAPVTIPAGREIHVVLDTAVSSHDNSAGDRFDATITEPVVVDGQTVVPQDARARGEVVDARPSGRLSKPALLTLALRSVQVNGAWVDVHTHDLTMEGKSHKKRDVVAIGGGSALGAIIGGIAGGGKGAAIGAAAGGGAGTAGAAITGKKDITLPSESHLTFRLSQSVSVQMQQ
ncbi:MAG TPA: hypothetical protein VKB26_01225 [Candidatus Acidoferrales bacterium]|nr:hypothetical protein [Candidatus Acidoferrales bacterium]